MEVFMLFHEKLCSLLDKQGMTVKDLSTRLNLAYSSVHNWTTGKAYPKLEHVPVLVDLLKCSYEFLLNPHMEKNLESPMIPLYSWVQAGEWTDIGQVNPDDLEYIELPNGCPRNCFAVRVHGHSMTRPTDTSICNGSIVFCQPVDQPVSPSALDGKVVIAQCGDGATLKQFVYDTPCFLHPWNPDPKYKDLIVDESVRIIGIVLKSIIDVSTPL